MASNVIRATLLADAQRMKAGFKEGERSVDSFEKSTGKSVKSVAGAVKGFLAFQAVSAVKAFADDSKRAFSEVEQSAGGTEAVFGDASGAIDAFARTSAQSIGLAESEFRTATTGIGGQLKRMTGDVDLAADQSIILTQVAADLAATYGGTTAEAVLALGAAFRGEADPAERFNLNLKTGAVNAKAVEMGLAKTTTEVDENAKAQATLALIMEQSADAQGQFGREVDTLAGQEQRLNAEIENNKALVGEAIQGVYKGAMPIIGGFHQALGNLAVAWMELTGAMSASDVLLQKMGEDYALAEAPVDKLTVAVKESITQYGHWDQAGKDFQDTLNGTVGGLELTVEQLEEMLDLVPQVAREQGLTTEATDAWKEAVERQIAVEKQKQIDLGRGKGREEEYAAALRGTEDQLDDNTEATDRATSALQRFEDEVLSQTDPMYGLVAAARDVADAEQAVIDAADEFTTDSPEHTQAVLDLAVANEGLVAAQLKVAEQSDMTRGEFEAHLRSMGGLTEEQIALIIGEFEKVNAFKFSDKTLTVNARLRGSSLARQALEDQFSSTTGGKAAGGPVTKGVPYMVGEVGEEVFVPDEDGTIVPNHKLGRGGTPLNGGGGTVINLIIPTDRRQPIDGWKIIEMLQQVERSYGPLPIKVRGQ